MPPRALQMPVAPPATSVVPQPSLYITCQKKMTSQKQRNHQPYVVRRLLVELLDEGRPARRGAHIDLP